MHLSTDRILTTHVGSLPRDPRLSELLIASETHKIDQSKLDSLASAGIDHVVQKQIESGIDVVSDGEQPRVSFMTYVAQRFEGYSGASERPLFPDFTSYSDFAALFANRGMKASKLFDAPMATSEINYRDMKPAIQECDMFDAALSKRRGKVTETFMTAATPGIVSTTLLNKYYNSRHSYLRALSRELKKEYDLIHKRGYVLQLDAPDLAFDRTNAFKDMTTQQFNREMEANIEAINAAIADIPPAQVRLHICWGNYDGPHDTDIDLADILPFLYEAKVGALSIEFANPRHQHEYEAIKKNPIPKDMALIPGVLDSTVNYVEHPHVVRNRILEAVDAVGDRERIIAGTDCGFGTLAGWELVAPSIVWKKFQSMAEGARLASETLWGGRTGKASGAARAAQA
jgi:5-methyltetrahydropteroyltriglutamate--homocysteine methyltransferase